MNPKAKQTTNTGRKLGLIVALLLVKKGTRKMSWIFQRQTQHKLEHYFKRISTELTYMFLLTELPKCFQRMTVLTCFVLNQNWFISCRRNPTFQNLNNHKPLVTKLATRTWACRLLKNLWNTTPRWHLDEIKCNDWCRAVVHPFDFSVFWKKGERH